MSLLRPLSPRPELVVGDNAAPIVDPQAAQLGTAGPLGRARVLYALPLNKQVPLQLRFARAIRSNGALLADPSGNVVGDVAPVWVARMLYARWTEDTRRLS
jgi:hypothetical protein